MGARTPETSSCRDTVDARAEASAAKNPKPSTKASTETTMTSHPPPGMVNVPAMPAAVSPTTPIRIVCPMASAPMPNSLPESSCSGRIADSTTSITRLDFSSTTPTATHEQ